MDLGRLNAAQAAAVQHGDAPLLVLAGAGTGKTTVITYRLAHLVQERGVRPERILAVTFTNKAAREMRERSAKLIGVDPRGLDIGTFHGMCGRILRRHGRAIGLQPSFVIYDEDDQLRLIKDCMAQLKLDPQVFPPQAIRHHIEAWKNQGETPAEASPSSFDLQQKKARDVYVAYAKACLAANAVDFGDLLLHTVTLLSKDAEARAALQARWTHVLVDEYQDTNRVQYLMLQRLISAQHSLTVVGDDDQSIYRWRGADIGNILRFERDFPGATLVRLEQNYRSTQTILDAANHVIAHNAARKGKSLFTDRGRGEPLSLRVFQSEYDEGEAIGQSIGAALGAGASPGEVAVLYRTNAQSRPLEDALRRRRIPYAVYGGMRFYDRKEIKDALAYLRLIVNPTSNVDFTRAIGSPSRGVGKTSLQKLAETAVVRGISFYEAAARVAAGDEAGITGKAKKGLTEFFLLIESLREQQSADPLQHFVARVLRESGYVDALKAEGTSEASDRVENLNELVAALEEYADANAGHATLAGFLEEAALATDVDLLREGGALVSLMTLHNAKGLEFEHVFLSGLEEGLFPHSRSLNDRAALEEERRLCYVGLTRAKRHLHLSAARVRTVFGEPRFGELSRFVGEIPDELVTTLDGSGPRRAPSPVRSVAPRADWYEQEAPEPEPVVRHRPSAGGFAPGVRVFHASFGEGSVIGAEGEGQRQKLTVEFPAPIGRKVIVARFVERR